MELKISRYIRGTEGVLFECVYNNKEFSVLVDPKKGVFKYEDYNPTENDKKSVNAILRSIADRIMGG